MWGDFVTGVRQARLGLACAGLGLAALLGGCGTYVPSHQEAGEEIVGVVLEASIVESIHCELRNAVVDVIAADRSNPESERGADFFMDWAVQAALTLTIQERTTFSPSLQMSFPPGLFTLGVGGSVYSDAKRVDKFSYYYTIQELLQSGKCDKGFADDIAASSGGSGSLLIRSDLKTREWLSSVLYNKVVGQASAKSFAMQKTAFSHDVQFIVDTQAGVMPGAKLATVTLQPSGQLLQADRTRTHDLTLTFGPASADEKKNQVLAPTAQSLFVSNLFSAALQGVRIVP